MEKCWHPDPLERPTASQLYKLLGSWVAACDDPDPSELSDQFNIAEAERNRFHQEIHPQAFYTSKLLYFPELFSAKEKN